MDYCFEFSVVQLIFVLFIFSITTTTLTIIIVSCVYVYDGLSVGAHRGQKKLSEFLELAL